MNVLILIALICTGAMYLVGILSAAWLVETNPLRAIWGGVLACVALLTLILFAVKLG